MSLATINYSGQLVVVTCWCGIVHAVPDELRRKQERDHANGVEQTSIFCPLGHGHIIAGEGEVDRLRRRLKGAQDYGARVAADRDQIEASRRAQKAATTRAKKRACAGVCPCCNRTFKQLAQHMQNKHPGFDPAADPTHV